MSDYQNHVKDGLMFESQINGEEINSQLKQLAFNLKTQDKNIGKIKKQLQARPTVSEITQSLVLMNSLIEIDPALSKQLKSKQSSKREDLTQNPINTSSNELGRKINQLSQSISILYSSFKGLEKKVVDLEFNTKTTINEKTTSLQEQIDDTNTKIFNQFHEVNEKSELIVSEFGDKIREVQTKTVWQINDCKMRLNSCINDQYVKDAVADLQKKMMTKIKEEQFKQGAIEPERIDRIESEIKNNQKQLSSGLTQINYRITTLKTTTQTATLSKQNFAEQKIELQKRFKNINTNVTDLLKRLKQNENGLVEHRDILRRVENFEEDTGKEIVRMNQVLKSLKIGDDFQKMLEKVSPDKIIDLDARVDALVLEDQRLSKFSELLKRQVEKIRAKSQFVAILTPNTDQTPAPQKTSRKQIEEIIHDYFVNNMFMKKIQNLQAQLIEVKSFPDIITDVNKKLARAQKQNDTHNLSFEIKGVQQLMKKENLVISNRLNLLEAMINEQKRKRPSSAGKNSSAIINEQNQNNRFSMSTSMSFKKLAPVNSISSFPNERKSFLKKM